MEMNNNSKKYKVLIVDDDHFLLSMYIKKFNDSGFEAVGATDGNEALAKIKDGTFNPDIVLLDMVMPVMDGFEIIEHIRKDHLIPNAKLIVLSNQSQSADIERAKKIGIAGYIVKATTIPSEVVLEVRNIVSGANEGQPISADQ